MGRHDHSRVSSDESKFIYKANSGNISKSFPFIFKQKRVVCLCVCGCVHNITAIDSLHNGPRGKVTLTSFCRSHGHLEASSTTHNSLPRRFWTRSSPRPRINAHGRGIIPRDYTATRCAMRWENEFWCISSKEEDIHKTGLTPTHPYLCVPN